MNGKPLIKATGLSPKTSTKGGSSYLVDRVGGVKILVLVNRDRRPQSEVPQSTLEPRHRRP
jgi:hypothetical protein